MPTEPGPDVVFLGETMSQLLPSDGRPVESARAFQLSSAGAESNAAHSLAQLGARVSWVSRLGDDAFGRRVLADVARAGVDVSGCLVVPGARTGLFVKDPAAAGSRVTYYRAGSAASAIDVGDIEVALRRRPRVLHLTGITPALSLSCHAAVAYALEASASYGIATTFDVNHRPALWPDRETAASVLAALANQADHVLVGLDEAEVLWGVRDAADVRRLLPTPQTVVVKDADREATCLCVEGPHVVPALPVDVVEPVGAGDAFAAGWLRGMLTDLPHEARLRLGHLVAREVLQSLTDHASFACRASDLLRDAVTGAPWTTASPERGSA